MTPNTSNDEIVVIVDEKNHVTGSLPRSEMRRLNEIHRACYILVFNSQGLLFVQKRTSFKDVYPDHYDVATGGVVLADETYDESAVRELAEEIGARDVPLQVLFDFYHGNDNCRVWGRVYKCVYDGDITLQEEEVESGEFHNIEDIFQLMETHPFTPDGVIVLKRYLAEGKDDQPL